MGKTHLAAAREGTDEIGLAVMATTFAIVAVFVPIAFMRGIIGQFFFQFGLTVAVAVLVSLFVSFTLDPMLSSVWRDPPRSRFRRVPGWVASWTAIERVIERRAHEVYGRHARAGPLPMPSIGCTCQSSASRPRGEAGAGARSSPPSCHCLGRRSPIAASSSGWRCSSFSAASRCFRSSARNSCRRSTRASSRCGSTRRSARASSSPIARCAKSKRCSSSSPKSFWR